MPVKTVFVTPWKLEDTIEFTKFMEEQLIEIQAENPGFKIIFTAQPKIACETPNAGRCYIYYEAIRE
jgi:hypothetical protein